MSIEKPIEIRKIEKILGYNIYQESISGIHFSKSLTCYSLNKNGNVNGIKLRYKHNSIRDINIIKDLSHLEAVNISYSFFEEFPYYLIESFSKLKYLNLVGNPIRNIPKEIYDRDTNVYEDVKTYLESIEKDSLYLHQAKLILIGNGEVGKSSIRIKLLDKNGILPKVEERTQGIEINKYLIKNISRKITNLNKEIDFELFIWDFGGQGRYREVQQLFCSRKALYVYVTSFDDKIINEEDYVGFEYWFSMAKAFGYDKHEKWESPIIHVTNKCDIKTKQINNIDISNIFGKIHNFVNVSCLTMSNFDKLVQSIRTALPKVSKDIFTNRFNRKWFDVKNELEEMREKNYINKNTYLTICESKGLNFKEANLWLDYLDRIGSIIYFRDNPNLNDFIILNPLWIRESIYKVLDSSLVKNGALKKEFFPFIWPDFQYFEFNKLLELILAYKLGYHTIDIYGESFYLIPALLTKERPQVPSFLINFDSEIRLEYTPYLPAGTVNKLMVELNEYIYQDLKWSNSCILHIPSINNVAYAEIIESWQEKIVSVKLKGSGSRTLLSIIRRQLRKLNQELKETKFLDQLDFKTLYKHENKYFSIDEIRKYNLKSKFPILLQIEKSSSKKSNDIPEFFISSMSSQITDSYKQIIRYRELKNREKDPLKRNFYQEEIELLSLNINEIENQFVLSVNRSLPKIDKDEISKKIDELRLGIFEKLDKIQTNNNDVLLNMEQLILSIDDTKISEDKNELIKANELLGEIYQLLSNAAIPNKDKLLKKINGEVSIGAKLKLTIPLIPGILKYESDLISTSSKEPIRDWKSLWNIFWAKK